VAVDIASSNTQIQQFFKLYFFFLCNFYYFDHIITKNHIKILSVLVLYFIGKKLNPVVTKNVCLVPVFDEIVIISSKYKGTYQESQVMMDYI